MAKLSRDERLLAKESRVRMLEEEIRLKSLLPHRYGWKWYPWAWEFYNSTNKTNLLVAANQISKSSTQIRKCIEWATNIELWPKLWKTRPTQFWYLYPTRDVVTVEVLKKWIPEFMPHESLKNDPKYGWELEKDKEGIKAINFNTGVTVFFKTYSQNVQHLQTSTPHAIFCDEELPTEIYDELKFRLAASNGYFHMVFTATLGQEFWRRAMEEIGNPLEKLPNAWKQTISAYDCKYYTDGSKSQWTDERIQEIIDDCSSEAEVQRRVFGRFIRDEGLVYGAYIPKYFPEGHITKARTIPRDWELYSAVDLGSGGKNHPAGIVFLAVNPEYTRAEVFCCWRGDDMETTAGDVYQQYVQLRGDIIVNKEIYDWASKDFGLIAERNGESFQKAIKDHELGKSIVNSLFKANALLIHDSEDCMKLSTELRYLSFGTDKRRCKDDLADPLRYICAAIPWDWERIQPVKLKAIIKSEPTYQEIMDAARRGKPLDLEYRPEQDINNEFDEWNSLYGE